jgi:hypothetical protein
MGSEQKKRAKPKRLLAIDSLPLAAALMACGCELKGINRDNPNRCIFEFADERVPDLSAKYITKCLPVDASTFLQRFDDLRSAVRRGAGEGGRQ